ncbi:MAG TPA: GNVR domain-containing protein [Patescibacteria group bacterium]|nr:GNVR domain-containing protein [Patescibacteria group bacterium]
MEGFWQGRSEPGAGVERALEVARRRARLGLLVAVALLVPGIIFVLSLPDVYHATATVLVERPQETGSLLGPATGDDLDLRFNALGEKILSRGRLSDLAERFDLYPALRGRLSPEELARRMRRDVQVELKGAQGSMLRNGAVAFSVTYAAKDPAQAASVANALAGLYVEEDVDSRRSQASAAAASLQSELEAMRSKLEAEEGRIREFNQRHAGELPQQVDANLASLQRLNTELQLNSEKQIRAMDRGDAAAGGRADSPTGSDGGAADDPDAELARLNRRLNVLRQSYSDSYPDVAAILTQIAALKRQQDAAGGRDGDGSAASSAAPPRARGVTPPAKGEVRVLRDEEQRLRSAIADLERRVESAPQRQQEFAELSRDYATTKELYGSLLKRHDEALLAAATGSGQAAAQFRVLDQALAPQTPAAPNRKVLLVMLLVSACGVALLAMALREQLDTSFHSVDSLRRFTRVPVLARIPQLAAGPLAWRRVLHVGALVLLYAAVVAASAGGSWYVARDYDRVVSMMRGGRS